MVQALAFAEIFLGLILADAAYKGVTISRVIRGEAQGAAPAPLGASTPTTIFGSAGSGSVTGSTPGVSLPEVAPTPQEAAKNAAFGPAPGNNPAFGAEKSHLEEELKFREELAGLEPRAEQELRRRAGR